MLAGALVASQAAGGLALVVWSGGSMFRVGGQGAWHKVGRAGGGIFDLYLNVDVHV